MVILLFGGAKALQGLQNLIVITALPFAIILILMVVALLKELRSDPLAIRTHFEEVALSKAVIRGVKEHGDNFALTVEPVEDEYATGADFDSTAEEHTDWYQRRDEEGNEVDYDYETGEYLDDTGQPAVQVDGDPSTDADIRGGSH